MFWKLFFENALLVFGIVAIGHLLGTWLIKDSSQDSPQGDQ